MAVKTGREAHERIKLTLDPQLVSGSNDEKACARRILIWNCFLFCLPIVFLRVDYSTWNCSPFQLPMVFSHIDYSGLVFLRVDYSGLNQTRIP